MKINLKLDNSNIQGQILIKDRNGGNVYGKIFCETPQEVNSKDYRKDIQNSKSKKILKERGNSYDKWNYL